jgi:hypothetical protein
MAWFQCHDTLPDHPKTYELARLLKVSTVQAIGHLICLFTWTARFRPDGEHKKTQNTVATASRWEGDQAIYIDALLKSGYLEEEGASYRVHDWSQYMRIVNRIANDNARRRKWYDNHKSKGESF